MKFIAVALIAIVALSTVRADVSSCVSGLAQPCTGDLTCATAYASWAQCVATNNCSSKTTLSDFKSCASTCTTTNTAVQTYINSYLACLNGKVLSFAAAMLALLAFMF